MALLSASQNTRHLRKNGDPTKALCDYYEKQIKIRILDDESEYNSQIRDLNNEL
ncbi:4276_t:CDS:2, partial [Gigaspora rosea]